MESGGRSQVTIDHKFCSFELFKLDYRGASKRPIDTNKKMCETSASWSKTIRSQAGKTHHRNLYSCEPGLDVLDMDYKMTVV